MKSTISSKGQVTVPAEVRRKLGLTAGTVVAFEVREGAAILRKGYDGKHPVDVVYGTLKFDRSTDEILDEMRGPRPGNPRSAKRASEKRKSRKRKKS
jgi:AbrB family looped-hinge helix DNA binding protein